MSDSTSKKKRKYSEDYLDYGFVELIDKSGVTKPQCMFCLAVLSAESMRPCKLKQHMESKHKQYVGKDHDFFVRHKNNMKKQRLDSTGIFQQDMEAAVEASFHVSYLIAQKKKPHNIGEELIKPCTATIVKLMLGENQANKLNKLSLSNNTVQRRIFELSQDIKEQVIEEIKKADLFSIQLDESTDVQSCAQLLVFVRYIHEGVIKEEFLFCRSIESTTRGEDVMKILSDFFEEEGLDWKMLCGVCTDGAPSMLGNKSGFVKLVKEKSPDVAAVHCMIHRQALACKTLPQTLLETLNIVIETVNFIKSSALNSRLFKLLCEEMNADHKNLLYYTQVRWLSKGTY